MIIMNIIKSLTTVSLLAMAMSAIAPQKAEARTCIDFGPGALCNSYQYSNRYGQVYLVGYANNNEVFGGEVICDDRNLVTWTGKKQYMTEGQVRWVVTNFCALPN